MVLQITLLLIAVRNGAEALEAADFTFGRFCNRPPNFGTGELFRGEGSDVCKMTYNVELDNDVAAANFCEQQHAYSLRNFTRSATQTICMIGNYFKCGDSEVLIDRTCYLVKNEVKGVEFVDAYRGKGCGSKHIVHKFKSQFEQKWVATYFTKYPMLWIGNSPEDPITKLLRFALQDEALVSKTGRMEKSDSNVMAVVTSIRTHTRIPRGSIVKADTHLSLPILCSRPAEQLPGYAQALMEKMSELGIRSHVAPDRHGKNRLFFVLREYSSFDMSEGKKGSEGIYEIGTKRLHKACSAFLNGYAASPLDFKNVEDFKKILREVLITVFEEGVNIVSVPGKRFRNVENSLPTAADDCHPSVDDGARKDFTFVLPDGTEEKTSTGDNHWAEGHPNRACADTPRIALGFTSAKGSVDIPAIARHFIVCTFGAPPPRSDPKSRCHFAATYDGKNCVCKAGTDYNDQQRFDRKKTEVAKGELCVDCEMDANHAVIIIVDIRIWGLHDAFLEIVPHVMFPFIVTNSAITIVIYGREYSFNNNRYSPGKDGTNYDLWRNLKEDLEKKEERMVGTAGNLFGVLDQYRRGFHNWLGSAPPHRRVLILMTAEAREEDVIKQLITIKNDEKVGKIFAFANYWTEKWPTVDGKVYHVDTEIKGISQDIWKAVTEISQHVAMNVCLRDRE